MIYTSRCLFVTLLVVLLVESASGLDRILNAAHPSWSPDGRTLVFEAGPEQDRQILALDLPSSTVTSLTSGPQTLAAPRFSPDGEWIAFLAMSREGIELRVLDRRQRDSSLLTTGKSEIESRLLPRSLARIEGAPTLLTWTPDNRIGFISQGTDSADLFVVDLQGKKEQLSATDYDERVPDSSPDGRQFAFHSSHEGPGDLYVRSLDNGSVRRLTNGPGRNRLPRWSPSGDQIVFQSDRSGNFEIYLFDLESQETRRVVEHPASDSIPSFSPDGRRIVFVSSRPRPTGESEGVDVMILDLETRSVECATCDAINREEHGT